jgi:hypothetical protein
MWPETAQHCGAPHSLRPEFGGAVCVDHDASSDLNDHTNESFGCTILRLNMWRTELLSHTECGTHGLQPEVGFEVFRVISTKRSDTNAMQDPIFLKERDDDVSHFIKSPKDERPWVLGVVVTQEQYVFLFVERQRILAASVSMN